MNQNDDLNSVLESLPDEVKLKLIPLLFGGGTGGAGGAAGPGGAAGGGGGAAGGGGGSGGVIYNVNYAPLPPDALLEWLTQRNPELAAALSSADEQSRRSGWERLRDWLTSQALTIPADIVGGIIGTLLLAV